MKNADILIILSISQAVGEVIIGPKEDFFLLLLVMGRARMGILPGLCWKLNLYPMYNKNNPTLAYYF